MKLTKRTLQTFDGVDASRRAGWAKYYEVEEQNGQLRLALAALVDAVLKHPHISSSDDISRLARLCNTLTV